MKDRLTRAFHDLPHEHIAAILGVSRHTVLRWSHGLHAAPADIEKTIARLERDPDPAISPKVPAESVERFRRAKQRAS